MLARCLIYHQLVILTSDQGRIAHSLESYQADMSFLLKGKGREPAQLTYRSPSPPAPFVDGIQFDEPYVSYHSVHTAFPDAQHSDVDVQHFDFPYSHPEDADYDNTHASATTLDSELASSVSYLAEAQILARILGNGRTLELRWMGYVNNSSRKIKSDNETLIRINFPRTLRNISASKCLYLNPSTGTLTVVLLDQQDGIYRLQFDAPLRQLEHGYMFAFDRHAMSRSVIDASYGTLQHQTIWTVYSEEGVAIGLEGSLLRCLWHGQGEHVLRVTVMSLRFNILARRLEFLPDRQRRKTKIRTWMALQLRASAITCIRNYCTDDFCAASFDRRQDLCLYLVSRQDTAVI